MATWGDFATALCGALNVPASQENVDAFLGWFLGEQGPTTPNAQFNPLNIQAGDFPHDGTSGSGQYNFPTFDQGVAQTAAFIRQGYYTGIVAALSEGGSCVDVLTAVENSPWAEGHYGYALHNSCATIAADRATYLAGQIAGVGGPSTKPAPAPAPGRAPGGVSCAAPFTMP